MSEQLITCKYKPDVEVETLGDVGAKLLLDTVEDKK